MNNKVAAKISQKVETNQTLPGWMRVLTDEQIIALS